MSHETSKQTLPKIMLSAFTADYCTNIPRVRSSSFVLEYPLKATGEPKPLPALTSSGSSILFTPSVNAGVEQFKKNQRLGHDNGIQAVSDRTHGHLQGFSTRERTRIEEMERFEAIASVTFKYAMP